MLKTLLCASVVTAVLGFAATPALGTTLAELPECTFETYRSLEIESAADMTIESSHATLMVGKPNAFTVEYNGFRVPFDAPWQFSAEIDGEPIPITSIDSRQIEATAHRAGKLTVAVTYGLGDRYNWERRPTRPPCRAVKRQSWRVVIPKTFPPKLNIRKEDEKVVFSLARIPYRQCADTYERRPVQIRVKQRGGRGLVATARSEDPCEGFDTWTEFLHVPSWRTFYFTERSPRALVLSLQWPKKKTATWRFDYSVRSGSSLQRGVLVAAADYRPAERIYAWLPGLQVNDDYWNFCVRYGRATIMENGNPYCNYGGYSTRVLRIARRP